MVNYVSFSNILRKIYAVFHFTLRYLRELLRSELTYLLTYITVHYNSEQYV